MKLIIGGIYQGKLTYAVKTYGLLPSDLFDLEKDDPKPGYACYYHLEAYVKRCIAQNKEPDCTGLKDAIVIGREVGSGVVPMEPQDRAYRISYGKLLRKLAEEADTVTRILCGLPEELK